GPAHGTLVSGVCAFGGRFAVSADRDGQVMRWDLDGGRALGPLDARATRVDVDEASGVLATAGDELVLWDLDTMRQLAIHPVPGRVDTVQLATVDGRTLVVAASWDGTTHVLDRRTGSPLVRPFPVGGHSSLAIAGSTLYVAGAHQV